MAATFVPFHPDVAVVRLAGAVAIAVGTVTFDSVYPSNGEVVTAATFGLTKLHTVITNGTSSVATKSVVYLSATSALKIFVEDAISGISAEAANGSDQALVTIPVIAIGTYAG